MYEKNGGMANDPSLGSCTESLVPDRAFRPITIKPHSPLLKIVGLGKRVATVSRIPIGHSIPPRNAEIPPAV